MKSERSEFEKWGCDEDRESWVVNKGLPVCPRRELRDAKRGGRGLRRNGGDGSKSQAHLRAPPRHLLYTHVPE